MFCKVDFLSTTCAKFPLHTFQEMEFQMPQNPKMFCSNCKLAKFYDISFNEDLIVSKLKILKSLGGSASAHLVTRIKFTVAYQHFKIDFKKIVLFLGCAKIWLCHFLWFLGMLEILITLYCKRDSKVLAGVYGSKNPIVCTFYIFSINEIFLPCPALFVNKRISGKMCCRCYSSCEY